MNKTIEELYINAVERLSPCERPTFYDIADDLREQCIPTNLPLFYNHIANGGTLAAALKALEAVL